MSHFPMPRLLVPAGLALACLILAPAARSADAPMPAPAFGDAALPVDLSGDVNLQSCVGQALGRNFTVRIQQFTVLSSEDNVAIQQAAFEPTFNFVGGRQVTVTPTDEQALGQIPYSSFDSGTFSVNDTLITGGTVTASYELVRSDYKPGVFHPRPRLGKHRVHLGRAAAPPGGRHGLQPRRDRERQARASRSRT